jgi:hypothetical protein
MDGSNVWKCTQHSYLGTTDPPPPGTLVLNAIVFDSLRARITTDVDSDSLRERAFTEFLHVR